MGQQELCRQHAADHGYTLVAELAEDDRGASGADLDLPELKRILEMARAGQFDVLVVREIDRLARNLSKQLLVEEELLRAGISIEYVLGDYPDTAEGRLNKHIRAVIAEYEREKIAQRVHRGKRNKVRAGHVSAAGHAPYGYRIITRENGLNALEIYEPEAKIVRLIFEWYTSLTDSLSLRAIARRLSEMNVPTYTDTGARPRLGKKKNGFGVWNPAAARTILRNPVYIGIWYYGKGKRMSTKQIINPSSDWIAVEVPAIVDPNTWGAAQERLKTNRAFPQPKYKHEYLMGRRIKCECGIMMRSLYRPAETGGKQRHYLYYKCAAQEDRNRYEWNECEMPSYRADRADDRVWAWLKGLMRDPDKMQQSLEEFKADKSRALETFKQKLAEVERDLADLEVQISRLIDLYLATGAPEIRDQLAKRQETIQAQMAQKRTDRDTLRRRVASLEAQVNADHLAVLGKFVGRLNFALSQADDEPFGLRQQLIELFDVQAEALMVDGKKALWVTSLIGSELLQDPDYTVHSTQQQALTLKLSALLFID